MTQRRIRPQGPARIRLGFSSGHDQCRENGPWMRLNGSKLFVTAAEQAHTILWVARLEGEMAIFAIERKDLHLEPQTTLAPTRRLCTVSAHNLEVSSQSLLARGDVATTVLTTATREATVVTFGDATYHREKIAHWVVDGRGEAA